MTPPISNNAKCRKKVYLVNMLLGAAVTVIALYMVITGEYSNLAERKNMESTLNMISLFGFLYSTAAWYGYIFFTPGCRDN